MSAATLPTSAAPASTHWWQSRTVRRFARHKLAVVGLAMITVLIFACVVGPICCPMTSFTSICAPASRRR